MAKRRMFSLDIVDTDRFLDMPVTSRCCYFELSMRADDDGFVSNPKRLMRMLNYSEDDLKLLIIKGFITPSENEGVVVTHWNMQNQIPSYVN